MNDLQTSADLQAGGMMVFLARDWLQVTCQMTSPV